MPTWAVIILVSSSFIVSVSSMYGLLHLGSNIEEDEDIRTRQRGENLMDRKMFKAGRLLSRLLPHVIYCMRAESSPPIIRNAATLAFAKFMIAKYDLSLYVLTYLHCTTRLFFFILAKILVRTERRTSFLI